MRIYLLTALIFLLPHSLPAQGDTTLNAYKKLFKWKTLPYDCSYNNKEFEMDSIWNSVEKNGYIHYRAEVKRKPESQLIPKYMVKRFLKMDTIQVLKKRDTLRAEFFALGYISGIRDMNLFIVERQFYGKNYRSSEKFIVTSDRRYRQIARQLLTHEIPAALDANNFDVLSDSFNELTWFDETKGIIYEDLMIQLEDELGKVTTLKIKEDGKISPVFTLKH